NWELSTARATAVVQHLIQANGLPPPHMAAIGYGEFHPIAANDTDDHRAMNRRGGFLGKNKPPNFDKGGKKEKKPEEKSSAEPAPEAEGADATAAPADASQPANTEPTTDNALPLPQEAPVDNNASQ